MLHALDRGGYFKISPSSKTSEVKDAKLAQDEEIKGIREEVINNVKEDITKGLE